MRYDDVSTMHVEFIFDVDSRWHVDWRWQGKILITLFHCPGSIPYALPITAYHSRIPHYCIPAFRYICIPHYLPLDLEMIPTACLLDW